MEAWESEIRIKNLERVLSITFQLTDFSKSIENDLEKGVISDDRVECTGQEIKEKLSAELIIIGTGNQDLLSRMQVLNKSIGAMPAGRVDRVLIKGFENQLTEIPMVYDYAQIYADGGYGDQMRTFNKAAGEFIVKSIEALKLQTVVDNLPDDRVLWLAPQLAEQLGFEKARGGVYKNTGENRKLGRVGQHYGEKEEGNMLTIRTEAQRRAYEKQKEKDSGGAFIAPKYKDEESEKKEEFSRKDQNRIKKLLAIGWSQKDAEEQVRDFENDDDIIVKKWNHDKG